MTELIETVPTETKGCWSQPFPDILRALGQGGGGNINSCNYVAGAYSVDSVPRSVHTVACTKLKISDLRAKTLVQN